MRTRIREVLDELTGALLNARTITDVKEAVDAAEVALETDSTRTWPLHDRKTCSCGEAWAGETGHDAI